MQPRSLPSTVRGDTATTVRRPSLAVVHAKALYRPTPPVECDDDGYPFSDAKPMSEGDFHGDVLDYAKRALRARYAGQDVYMSTDKGWRLDASTGREPIPPSAAGAFRSETLGLDLFRDGRKLRFAIPRPARYSPSTRSWLRCGVPNQPLGKRRRHGPMQPRPAPTPPTFASARKWPLAKQPKAALPRWRSGSPREPTDTT